MTSEIQAGTINFLAKTISFPGKSLGSTTYRSGGQFGLDVPYETTYEPVSLTMLNTGNHAPRKFWNSWFEHIQSMDTRNMQYYKNFIGSITISVYNEEAEAADQPTHKVTLHECMHLLDYDLKNKR